MKQLKTSTDDERKPTLADNMKTVRSIALAVKNRTEARHYSPLTNAQELLTIAQTCIQSALAQRVIGQEDASLITTELQETILAASIKVTLALNAANDLSERIGADRELSGC